MNIFKEAEGIIGELSLNQVQNTMEEFWKQASCIHKRLERKSYLLVNYLDLLFNAVNHQLAFDAADEGFSKLSEYRKLLLSIVEGKDDFKEHPLYAMAKEYIENYPVGYQECHTKISVYLAGLANEIFSINIAKFTTKEANELYCNIDFVRIQELYNRIIIHIGSEEPMERLNFLFRQRFIIAPLVTVFLQGFNNDLIYILLHRDDETHRQIFQLFYEDLDEYEVPESEK